MENIEEQEDVEIKPKLNIIDPSANLEKKEKKFLINVNKLLNQLETPIIGYLFTLEIQNFQNPLQINVWENNNIQFIEILLNLLEFLTYEYKIKPNNLLNKKLLFCINSIGKFINKFELLQNSQVLDGNLENTEFYPIIQSNSKSFGCFWFHYFFTFEENFSCFIESPLHPVFIFNGCLIYIYSLLQAEIPVVVYHGIKLLEKLIEFIEDNSLYLEYETISSSNIYILIFQELFNNMSKHPQKEQRQDLYGCFRMFLNIFSESTQFHILSLLISKCPFISMKGELIHQLKENIHRIWKLGNHSPSWKLIFSAPYLNNQLQRIQNLPTKPIEQIDHVMNYLNLIRFLLILDSKNIQPHLLSVNFRNKCNTKYLSVQIEHATGILNEHYKALDSPAHAKKFHKALDTMAKDQVGLSSLSSSDFSEGTMRLVTELQLVIDLTKRVQELIKIV